MRLFSLCCYSHIVFVVYVAGSLVVVVTLVLCLWWYGVDVCIVFVVLLLSSLCYEHRQRTFLQTVARAGHGKYHGYSMPLVHLGKEKKTCACMSHVRQGKDVVGYLLFVYGAALIGSYACSKREREFRYTYLHRRILEDNKVQ